MALEKRGNVQSLAAGPYNVPLVYTADLEDYSGADGWQNFEVSEPLRDEIKRFRLIFNISF